MLGAPHTQTQRVRCTVMMIAPRLSTSFLSHLFSLHRELGGTPPRRSFSEPAVSLVHRTATAGSPDLRPSAQLRSSSMRTIRSSAASWLSISAPKRAPRIDSHEAVIRINLTPDGPMAAEGLGTPHRHVPTWIADVGARTSWRVVTMEVYGSAASKSSPHAQALSHLR